jgi:hypothetical protein
MDKEQILRDATEQLINLIGMPEEYIPDYFDDIMQTIEEYIANESSPQEFASAFANDFADGIESDLNFNELVDEISEIYFQAYEEYTGDSAESLYENTRSDYNVKYGGANGPFDEIYKTANSQETKPGSIKPAVKSKPGNWKYNDGGWGPIPRSGLGRREYEAKYSKTGSILEENIWADGVKRPGVISPALREAVASYEAKRKLLENKLIDKKDLDLLMEEE